MYVYNNGNPNRGSPFNSKTHFPMAFSNFIQLILNPRAIVQNSKKLTKAFPPVQQKLSKYNLEVGYIDRLMLSDYQRPDFQ